MSEEIAWTRDIVFEFDTEEEADMFDAYIRHRAAIHGMPVDIFNGYVLLLGVAKSLKELGYDKESEDTYEMARRVEKRYIQ